MDLGKEIVVGQAAGISAHGYLLLKLPNGEVRSSFQDISSFQALHNE
jgi:hypothetical protein